MRTETSRSLRPNEAKVDSTRVEAATPVGQIQIISIAFVRSVMTIRWIYQACSRHRRRTIHHSMAEENQTISGLSQNDGKIRKNNTIL